VNDLDEPKPAQLLDLGTREYGEVWELQRELVGKRQRDEIPDTLVLVEHPHVITLGRGTHKENVLAPGDTPIFEIERGGDVTYHGPGQLVGYPIFLLRQPERDLHLYLRNLEESLIRTVGRFGIAGERKAGWTGVWTAGGARKLASIGVAVRRFVTWHGLALNVAPDLAEFQWIRPCGFAPDVMTSLQRELGTAPPMDEVRQRLVVELVGVLGIAPPIYEPLTS